MSFRVTRWGCPPKDYSFRFVLKKESEIKVIEIPLDPNGKTKLDKEKWEFWHSNIGRKSSKKWIDIIELPQWVKESEGLG